MVTTLEAMQLLFLRLGWRTALDLVQDRVPIAAREIDSMGWN